jgi:hypothetical protein
LQIWNEKRIFSYCAKCFANVISPVLPRSNLKSCDLHYPFKYPQAGDLDDEGLSRYDWCDGSYEEPEIGNQSQEERGEDGNQSEEEKWEDGNRPDESWD